MARYHKKHIDTKTGVAILIIALAIPITILFSKQSQDTRQHAAAPQTSMSSDNKDGSVTSLVTFSSYPGGSTTNAAGKAVITGKASSVDSPISFTINGGFTGLTPGKTYTVVLNGTGSTMFSAASSPYYTLTVVADSSGNASVNNSDFSINKLSTIKQGYPVYLQLWEPSGSVPGIVGASADATGWFNRLMANASGTKNQYAVSTINFASIPGGSTTNAAGKAIITGHASGPNDFITFSINGSFTGLTPYHTYTLTLESSDLHNFMEFDNADGSQVGIVADSSGNASIHADTAKSGGFVTNLQTIHYQYLQLVDRSSMFSSIYPAYVGVSADVTAWLNLLLTKTPNQ